MLDDFTKAIRRHLLKENAMAFLMAAVTTFDIAISIVYANDGNDVASVFTFFLGVYVLLLLPKQIKEIKLTNRILAQARVQQSQRRDLHEVRRT